MSLSLSSSLSISISICVPEYAYFNLPAQHLAFALFAVGGAVDLLTLPDAAAHLERGEQGGRRE